MLCVLVLIGSEWLCIGRCGPLIDLCRGPHVRHTGKIKAMKIYKVRVRLSSESVK